MLEAFFLWHKGNGSIKRLRRGYKLRRAWAENR